MKKMTIDGNYAASYVAYSFSEVAAIYPITPSSGMAEYADEWAAEGVKNIFGQPLKLAEMQSEAGAAGAVHGSLCAGALSTTFTASQGLLLMIPNMYKIAGELLPTVFHVSARALAAHALSIFGDHQDVMACRQTGFGMLSSNSVQEALDLSLVAHLVTLKSKVPFLHFFDGFRTSHEVSKVDVFEYTEMKKLVDKLGIMKDIEEFKARALNPAHPIQKGTAQNPDIYFQNREAANKYYAAVPKMAAQMMEEVSELTGRKYELYQYYGPEDAEHVVVMMGSGADAAEETIDYYKTLENTPKVGLLKVRLYRPFAAEYFVNALPKSVKKIAVLDRTKEAGSLGEPLYLDVIAALKEQGRGDIEVIGGRYGLGSKEFNPSMVHAVYKNLAANSPKNKFTIGINDDVTYSSLPNNEFINASPKGTSRCKFYGLGSDGTVGANKNSIKIIGDYTNMYAQGYFVYDSKKSGGFTISHLRFGNHKIKSSYLIDESDFSACHNQSYVTRYDMTSDIKEGGVFLLNCQWDINQLEKELPAKVKQDIARKKLKFYTIDALKIAHAAGMGNRINSVMQAAFFKLANIIPYMDAEKYMYEAIEETYGKKGEAVVLSNKASIDKAIEGLVEIKVPSSWANADKGAGLVLNSKDKYYTDFIAPILAQEGNKLPVSSFSPDGMVPTGTTLYEKRGTADALPMWIKESCIQCNQCALVCPHGCIRPVLCDAKETVNAPKTFETLAATGLDELNYRIQVSPLDCMGCAQCANICPTKNKSLIMKPFSEIVKAYEINWNYALKVKQKDVSHKFKKTSVKGSQFLRPYFEFSGACAGCGETPYVKLVTQLFGDRMVVANATGCSSIFGGSAPTCPYSKDDKGKGPAWANSLFEDNAEFGFGFELAYVVRRNKLAVDMELALELGIDAKLARLFDEWIKNRFEADETKRLHGEIMAILPNEVKAAKGEAKKVLKDILMQEDCLIKKSIWIIGGDGWAYDIGYGGLDHVLASGEDVNLLVLDTEVYSNTGGQTSKATPTGSVAKFSVAGKRTRKKDLGLMAMAYGNVYVGQIALGANMQQAISVLEEAEKFKGPSVIIAYATCRDHGIDMSNGQLQTKRAVESGYWSLYRYNPNLSNEGKNPFVMESAAPSKDYIEFIKSEGRYQALLKSHPELAEELFERAAKEAKERLAIYSMMGKRE
ncbi:MAG: pyruvate:ferredoxin (flavodoxin) oxidoreductase [Firmicutes bacterium]|nr:pyruvate:ferredoxin (flavodoxin) oxidoreductase [Bacillota bacterium]